MVVLVEYKWKWVALDKRDNWRVASPGHERKAARVAGGLHDNSSI